MRAIVGDVPFLVPGVGAQGGDVEAVVTQCEDRRRHRPDGQFLARDPVCIGRRRLRRGRARRGARICATRSTATAELLRPGKSAAVRRPAAAWLIAGIPHSLRSAITAGIGLFLAIIALQKSGVIVGNPDTLVSLGDLREPEPLLAVAGFLLIAVLEAWRVRGAILIGILAVTAAALLLGLVQYRGIVDLPPSLAPTFLQLDIARRPRWRRGLSLSAMLHVVIVFVLVEVFDATGTLMGVARRAGLLPIDDATPAQQKRFGRALFADSSAILAGSLLGTSSTTAYIESASGVQAGGRTGLTALVIAALFLLALLFSPLASMVPPYDDRAGVAVRGRTDAARTGRRALGRPHRVGPGGAVHAGDAVHLLDRQRPGIRLHRLRGAEAVHRARTRGALRRCGWWRCCSCCASRMA